MTTLSAVTHVEPVVRIAIAVVFSVSFFGAPSTDGAAAQSEATYWVAPDGAGKACTETEPCPAAYAVKQAEAGQTWYFKAGTYPLKSPLVIRHSGEPDAPITFSAAPGAEREVVFDGAGWKAVKASHIRIAGFKIQNTSGDGIRFECRPEVVCDDIRIENNWTLKTHFSGIAVHGGLFKKEQYATDNVTNLVIVGNRVEEANAGGVTENISVSNGVNGAEIAHNELVNGFNLGIDVKAGVRNIKIHHNTIEAQRGAAIYLDTNRRYVEDVEVYSNRIVGGKGKTGIRLAREVWSPDKLLPDGPNMARIRIYNNVIDGIRGTAISLQRIKVDDTSVGTFRDISVTNNTIVKSKSAVVVDNHPLLQDVVIENNLAETNGKSYSFGVAVTSSNNISSDGSEGTTKAVPQFMDLDGKDYRLKPGSPGADRGAQPDAPAAD